MTQMSKPSTATAPGASNDGSSNPRQPRYVWPWVVLAAALLGLILFIVWVWFAVQGVKRIKASTEQAASNWESMPRCEQFSF